LEDPKKIFPMLFVSNADALNIFWITILPKELLKNMEIKELSEYSFCRPMVSDDNFHHTNILFQKITQKPI